MREEVRNLNYESNEDSDQRVSLSVDETTRQTGFTLLIDPGSASAEEIAELYIELSALYRMLGGSGITFRVIDAKEPVPA